MATQTAVLKMVRRMTGRIQSGFRAMSSKVALGEKNTPTTRAIGLSLACVWGADTGRVAIEDSFTTGLDNTSCQSNTYWKKNRLQSKDSSAIGSALALARETVTRGAIPVPRTVIRVCIRLRAGGAPSPPSRFLQIARHA